MAGAWTSFIRAKRMLEVLGMKCPQLILKLKWVRSKTCTRGPEGPWARRARTQNQKIENFNFLVTRPGWIDQKTPNFEIFNFWACYPALKTKKVEISKFSIFLLTRHSTRPQKSEISKISMDRTPPHDQGAHPWKKKSASPTTDPFTTSSSSLSTFSTLMIVLMW